MGKQQNTAGVPGTPSVTISELVVRLADLERRCKESDELKNSLLATLKETNESLRAQTKTLTDRSDKRFEMFKWIVSLLIGLLVGVFGLKVYDQNLVTERVEKLHSEISSKITK